MELANDFRVSVPPQQAFDVLTDVERIAPLLPGAALQEIEGDEYRGVVKVKVGPITASYKGTASFLERDAAAGRVVLKATGRDTRGQGNANATITAVLKPDGDGTKVSVTTDLAITGKVAQFGRGVLADVSGKLIGQFVDALERDLSNGSAPAPAATAQKSGGVAPAAASPIESGEPLVGEQAAEGKPSDAPAPTPATEGVEAVVADGPVGAGATAPLPEGASATIRTISSAEPEPVDLFDAAGGTVAKRLLPLLGVAGAIAVVVVLRRRRAARRRRGLARLSALAPAAVNIAQSAPAQLAAAVDVAGDVVATGRRAARRARKAAGR